MITHNRASKTNIPINDDSQQSKYKTNIPINNYSQQSKQKITFQLMITHNRASKN